MADQQRLTWREELMWAWHNLAIHPFSELLYWCGLKRWSQWVHDASCPRNSEPCDPVAAENQRLVEIIRRWERVGEQFQEALAISQAKRKEAEKELEALRPPATLAGLPTNEIHTHEFGRGRGCDGEEWFLDEDDAHNGAASLYIRETPAPSKRTAILMVDAARARDLAAALLRLAVCADAGLLEGKQ